MVLSASLRSLHVLHAPRLVSPALGWERRKLWQQVPKREHEDNSHNNRRIADDVEAIVHADTRAAVRTTLAFRPLALQARWALKVQPDLDIVDRPAAGARS